jgi:hypothetical protein
MESYHFKVWGLVRKKDIAGLNNALRTGSHEVRQDAAKALANLAKEGIGNASSLPALIEGYRRKDFVFLWSVEATVRLAEHCKIAGPESVIAMSAAITECDPDTKAIAITGLLKLAKLGYGHIASIPHLNMAMKMPVPDAMIFKGTVEKQTREIHIMATKTILALAELGVSEQTSVPILVEMLNDPDYETRMTADAALRIINH